jgi:hypothetical protein
MDLSKSMEDDKEKLSALGDLLAATMQVQTLVEIKMNRRG